MGGMTEDWGQSLAAVVAAGADAVEVGIPFSDPMMDGPVIQEAALTRWGGAPSPTRCSTGSPGPSDGPDGRHDLLQHRVSGRPQTHGELPGGGGGQRGDLPDLSLEEIAPWAVEADAAGIETVLLVAPSSPEDRVARIFANGPTAFVYAVARMGVTGERADLGDEARLVVEKIRRHTDMPICVGVGVSTPEQAAEVCEVADGVVVGSALVRRLIEGGGPEAAAEFVGRHAPSH